MTLQAARENLSTLAAFVEAHRAWLDWDAPQTGYTACVRLRSGVARVEWREASRRHGVFLHDGAACCKPDRLRIGLALPGDLFASALDGLGRQLRQLPQIGAPPGAAEVILYTKLPRAGEGKSRLADDIGAENAAALAMAFYSDTLSLQGREAARSYVAVASRPDVAQLRLDLPGRYVYAQEGSDMGARLSNALAFALQYGARRPVLIGSDSPTLPGHLLQMAHRALATHDLVLGPALDGGYYLIGVTRPQPALFEGIEWSTERVLAQTLDRIRELGLRVFCLPYWYDVDTAADLDRLRCDARPDSETHAALQRLENTLMTARF